MKPALALGATLASTEDFVPERVGHVYALVEASEPDRVRYVGSTVSPVSRLHSHVVHGQARRLRKWLQETIAAGGIVLMRTLATSADRQALYDIEGEQTEAFRALGMADLNQSGLAAYSLVHSPRRPLGAA